MKKFGFDWSSMTKAATDLLKTTVNPLHRAILTNYRRHVLLENGQRYPEIFTPEMMVDEPRYYVSFFNRDGTIEGRQSLWELYSKAHFQVFQKDEMLGVSDRGILTESHVHQFAPAMMVRFLGLGDGSTSDDSLYCISYYQSMVWHYDDRGLMIGENVYQQRWSVKVDEVDEDEPSKDEVAVVLSKVIEETDPEWRAALLVGERTEG